MRRLIAAERALLEWITTGVATMAMVVGATLNAILHPPSLR